MYFNSPSCFKRSLLIFFVILYSNYNWAQSEQEAPTGNLSTPQEAAFQHIYYLQENQYNLEKSAQALIGKGNEVTTESKARAIKLKQILDGKGLILRPDLIPDNPDYIDSVSKNHVYVPFPKKMPHIYLVRPTIGKNKRNRKLANFWRYSKESYDFIPELHREVH